MNKKINGYDVPEERQIVPISKQQSFFVAKSNEMIQRSRFTLTTQQNKIMLYLISKIRPADIGDEMYSVSIREFCKVCNIDYNNGQNYIDIKNALKGLADKSIWIMMDNGDEVLLRWLDRIIIRKETGTIDVKFHTDMLPFLYDLKSRYTRYSLENVLLMTSKYSIRLYELLKSFEWAKETVTFSLEELKIRLDAETYKRYPDFRRKVLDKAIDEINTYGDFMVEYTPHTSIGSRAITHIEFSISEMTHFDSALRHRRLVRGLDEQTKKRDRERDKKMREHLEQKRKEQIEDE